MDPLDLKKMKTEIVCDIETDKLNFTNSEDNHFTFNLQVYSQDDSNCSADSCALRIETDQEHENEKPTLKRKREHSSSDEEEMPEILNKMEKQIELQLDSKAAKSNLTVANVKNILKHVITNEQVLQMVRQKMNNNFDVNQWKFPPKLTRSKTKELMKLQPNLWPVQSQKPTSKCHDILIAKELQEDNSDDDDEYQPNKPDKEYLESEDEKEDKDENLNTFQELNVPDTDANVRTDEEDEEYEEAEEEEIDEEVEEEEVEEEEMDEEVEEEEEIDDELEEEEEEEENAVELCSQIKIEEVEVQIGTEISNDIMLKEVEETERRDIHKNNSNFMEKDNETEMTSSNINKQSETIQDYPKDSQIEENSVECQKSGEQYEEFDAIDKYIEQIKMKTHQTMSLPCKSNNKMKSEFLIPEKKVISTKPVDGTISQRTRSKFSLSATPLEHIEQAFMPPDITTDMYETECDDEDYRNFLIEYMEPLAEMTPCEYDEHIDPEYNVMAEEEDIDFEELRIDRGVKITKKEMNSLISEIDLDLFSEMYTECEILDNLDIEKNRQQQQQQQQQQQEIQESQDQHDPQPNQQQLSVELAKDQQPLTIELNNERETIPQNDGIETTLQIPKYNHFVLEDSHLSEDEVPELPEENDPLAIKETIHEEVYIKENETYPFLPAQILVLEQQLRKHIQLTFQHYMQFRYQSITGENSDILKNLLLKLKHRAYNNQFIARIINLQDTLVAMDQWDTIVDKNHQRMLKFHQDVIKLKKRTTNLFPKEMMDFVVNSKVFIYPLMLPYRPFYYDKLFWRLTFDAEQHLFALGMEQFVPYVEENSLFKDDFKHAFRYIIHYLMPTKTCEDLKGMITKYHDVPGPIKYYLEHKKAPISQHFVVPVNMIDSICPIKQPLQLLPFVWKTYVQELRNPKKKPNQKIRSRIKKS